MNSIVVALAREFPVGGPIWQLTEYGPVNGETVILRGNLGVGQAWALARADGRPGLIQCPGWVWARPAAEDW